MFKNLNILNLASAMTAHAAQRHSVVAENIANADTPNYKARDVESFNDVFKSAQIQEVPLALIDPKIILSEQGDALSPNGNSVSLEAEMMKSAEAVNTHDLSLQIYKKSLSLMKIAIGKNM